MRDIIRSFVLGIALLCMTHAASATPIPTEPTAYITFQGICLDCLDGQSPSGQAIGAGQGIDTGNPSYATAILGVASPGNLPSGHTDLGGIPLNLLTFSYQSALYDLEAFHINEISGGTISNLPGLYTPTFVQVLFRIDDQAGDVFTFRANNDGSWYLREGNWIGDFGIEGRFNVPVPSTLALLGLGFLGLGWSRRR